MDAIIAIIIVVLIVGLLAVGRLAWVAHERIDTFKKSENAFYESVNRKLSAQNVVNEKFYVDIQALREVDSFAVDLLQKLPADCFSTDNIIQPNNAYISRVQYAVLCALCDYLHVLDASLKPSEKVLNDSKVD